MLRIFVILAFLIAPVHAQTLNGLNAGSVAKVSAGAGCSQATTFLARTSGLNGTHTTAYTNLICGLVTDGVFSKFDALYILATADSTTASLNLVSTSFTLTTSSSPAFTIDHGYATAAGTGTLITGFNPTTAPTPQYVQNSAHYSIWNNTNNTSSDCMMGNDAAGATGNLFIKFGDNNFYARINDSSGSAGNPVGNPIGLEIGNRSGASAIQAYLNGVSVGSNTTTSAAPANASIQVITCNGAGAADSIHQVAEFSFGSSLSSTDASNFYTRVQAYMTAVGN